ncbi:TolC family protein [Planctomicrobium sp. SH664]|uniref:TolC family protein n=1 Tax=Planctomicrobium sp. SH664 TaxID=3448125 RepID=UPI003F5C8592
MDRQRLKDQTGIQCFPLSWKVLGAATLCALALGFNGCKSQRPTGLSATPYVQAATAIEYPDVDDPNIAQLSYTPRPISINSPAPEEFRDITLQETMQSALANSKIFRDLGGIILRNPLANRSTYDPAIQETDPRFGPQAALAAFDATFATSLFYEHNDRALNNQFFGGGTRLLAQETGVFQSQIAKRTPFGGQYALRHNVEYDANNAPGNMFPSAWDVNFEMEYRQKLLRGAGIDFGRIAGVSEIPGVYTGILVARINTDVSIADFESGVRDFVSDVENAYWDLYFAYRDLDAKITARNSSLETWRRVQALNERGRIGGEADKEAEAREQYYRFQEEVENALTGRLIDGTRTFNGSSGGTFRSIGGVHVAERRLRFLMGIATSDHELLRPSEEPTRAEIVFDWDLSLRESLEKRSELRRQKWMVKRRELELLASRNFLLPDLDVVALQRWRGFGNDLLLENNPQRFSSAYDNLIGGDFQESRFGVEMAFPFGSRQGHAAVRNAEFLLAREKALLKEQEQRVVHDLSNAMADIDRAYQVMLTVYNRREAARERVKALQAAFEADKAPLNLVLDAQRRLAASETNYYQCVIEYNNAVKNVHFEKGTLLEYAGVHLSEGPWPNTAYEDALERLERRINLHGQHLPEHRVISTGTEPPFNGLPPAMEPPLPTAVNTEPVIAAPVNPAPALPPPFPE